MRPSKGVAVLPYRILSLREANVAVVFLHEVTYRCRYKYDFC